MREPDAPELPSRRRVLVALATAPLAAVAGRAEARDYGSAGEVFSEISRLEMDVEARLSRLAQALPGAAAFARSVAATHAAHRRDRGALGARLRVDAPGAPTPAPGRDVLALDALRAVAQDLVHAHAEGLPALGDAEAVDVLARHMVDVQRHLTVIDLWIEGEGERA